MLENVAAQDTLEGIVEWWLLEKKIQHSTAEVKSVLDQLSAKNLIVEFNAPDSRVRYRINRRKKTEIVAFLKEAGGN
jgi:Fe2+ or Zn2+ uptake regulation protein